MPVPKAGPLLVLDTLHSTPVRRYLSAERVPDDVVWAILDAAMRGPSGGNQQSWAGSWSPTRRSSSRWPGGTREGWCKAYGHRREQILAAAPPASAGLSRQSFLGAEHLVQHIEQAPVWIFPVFA